MIKVKVAKRNDNFNYFLSIFHSNLSLSSGLSIDKSQSLKLSFPLLHSLKLLLNISLRSSIAGEID